MDPCELDSIKRKKREELIQLTIVLVTKLIVIVTTIIHEQVHQIKEVPMQARDKIRHRLQTQPPRKRQKKGKSPLVSDDRLVIAIDTIKDHMSTIANTWKEAQKREKEVVEQKKNLLSEVAIIEGVSQVDAIDATSYLSRNSSELDAFYSCPNDEWKKLYVERLVARLRGGAT